jgi:hypothetical protein
VSVEDAAAVLFTSRLALVYQIVSSAVGDDTEEVEKAVVSALDWGYKGVPAV